MAGAGEQEEGWGNEPGEASSGQITQGLGGPNEDC